MSLMTNILFIQIDKCIFFYKKAILILHPKGGADYMAFLHAYSKSVFLSEADTKPQTPEETPLVIKDPHDAPYIGDFPPKDHYHEDKFS